MQTGTLYIEDHDRFSIYVTHVFACICYHAMCLYKYIYYVGIKVPSGLMFLVICNLTIKNISYLILSYLISYTL